MKVLSFEKKWWLGCMLAVLVASCGGGSSSSSTSSGTTSTGGTTSTSTPAGGIVNPDGTAVTELDTNDPVYLSLSGLDANAQYTITVTAPDGSELSPTGGFIASADEDGAIPTSTLLQDLSTTSNGSSLVLWSSRPEPRLAAQEGEYEIVVTDADGDTVLEDTFDVVDDDKVYCADSSGVARASFTSSEAVYAKIEKGDNGTLADGTYSCYVLSDLNAALENEETLAGTPFAVTVSSGTGLTSMGAFSSGQYDVVCDLDANGEYDAGSDLLARPGRFRPCFTIQEVNSGDHIVGQVCSDRNGNYRDVFDPNADDSDIRDVWAWISPSERSLVEHTLGVRKYVVSHQDSWTDGESLTDVTGASGADAFEVDAVQGFCTNEAPWMVWPRERLTQGCYDCIIDVDANGVYDQGTDFVDNIDNSGDNTTCGMRVTDGSCASDYIQITSHDDADTVTATAITLAGSFSDVPDSASVIITSGTQSTTVALSVGEANPTTGRASFSADIPLYNGENHVTVVAVTGAAEGCAQTIVLTSSSEASSDELFRAQLTWDGDTDMDLHLVRPNGAYSNGGYGDDDCNYGNCKVGLEGTDSNSIDWGTSGDDDDPKLDVDCISCGNGIENIWMNAVPEDGEYDVYVDAFSGTETVVNVAISIRGATVGTVSCGAMSAGTATDSCFVGTISWSGGNTGNGTFTLAGTKAQDF